MTPTVKAHLQMLIFTFLLGLSFIASAAISHTLDPMIITWLRYLIASVIFILLLRSQGLLQWPDWRDLVRYTLISLPPLLYFTCMIFAVKQTSALDASALYTSVPLLSAMMGYLCFKIRTPLFIWLVLLLGLFGALLLIYQGDITRLASLSLTPSNQLFLFGCLGMALNPIVVRWLYRGEKPLVMTGWTLICATLLLTLAVGHQIPSINWLQISMLTWSGIFYLAVFATAVSFWLFQRACVVLNPMQISAYVYLIPLSVMLTNQLFGDDQPWLASSGGILLVLISMVIMVVKKTTVKKRLVKNKS